MRDIFSCLVAIPILLIARAFALNIPYTNQGFFCDDDEIRYPDRNGTVSSHKMHLIYAIFITVLVPISEMSLSKRFSGRYFNRTLFIKTIFFYSAFTCGVLATSVATNVFKRTSSRLRPNFIAVCRPADLDLICPLGSNSFVENFTCLGESRPDLHFSFPSSHASHSLYFLVFLTMYLHRRFRFPNIIRAFVQLAVFVISIFICLSRVRDFKHRYEDVAGGGILGIVMGSAMIHLILFNFKHHRYGNHEDRATEKVHLLRRKEDVERDFGSLVRRGYYSSEYSQMDTSECEDYT